MKSANRFGLRPYLRVFPLNMVNAFQIPSSISHKLFSFLIDFINQSIANTQIMYNVVAYSVNVIYVFGLVVPTGIYKLFFQKRPRIRLLVPAGIYKLFF